MKLVVVGVVGSVLRCLQLPLLPDPAVGLLQPTDPFNATQPGRPVGRMQLRKKKRVNFDFGKSDQHRKQAVIKKIQPVVVKMRLKKVIRDDDKDDNVGKSINLSAGPS